MRLEKETVRKLKEEDGLTAKEIAEIDGTVGTTAIYAVLERMRNPELGRKRQERYYNKHRKTDNYKCKHRKSEKEWRKKNISKWRNQRNKVKQKRQQETKTLAVNRRQPWTKLEIAYLKKYGRKKTIKELAIKLGRSYSAVQGAAYVYGINLFSAKKASGIVNRTFKNKQKNDDVINQMRTREDAHFKLSTFDAWPFSRPAAFLIPAALFLRI